MEPAPYVPARRSTPSDDLVMTPAAAQVTRPARPARLLAVDVAGGEPLGLELAIGTGAQVPHRAGFVADESVTGEQPAVHGNAEIPGSGTAGIGAVRTEVDLPHRRDHVRERVPLSGDDPALELAAPQAANICSSDPIKPCVHL